MRRPFDIALVVLSFAAGLGLAVRAWAKLADDPGDFGPTPAAARAARDSGFGPLPEKAEPLVLAEVSDAAFGPAPEAPAEDAFAAVRDPFGAVRGAQTPPSRGVKPARDSDDPFGGLETYKPRQTRSAQPAALPDPFPPNVEAEREASRRAKQTRLVTLAREAADLASDAELDRLLGEFESTVNEKRAEAELQQARAALERVVAAFPQTGAATAARDMLDRHPEPPPGNITPVEAPRP